jgi:long-chain fatty acid transport protein
MRRGTVITSLVLAGGLPAVSGTPAEAAGFQLQEQTASGLGVAYAGMPAAAQDAGVVFWNPAAMPLLPGTRAAAAAHFIKTSFDFRSAGPLPEGSTYDRFGDGGNAGGGSWVPALYGKMSISPRLSVGLAINAPFGLSTEWHGPWAGTFHGLTSEVETLNINPAIGYRLGSHLSIGAGVSYQRLEATLTNGVTPLLPAAQGELQGEDWAYGWNVGALIEFGQGTRVGLTYRSAISYSIEGDLTFDDAALVGLASGVKADLKLPPTVAVGVSHQINPSLRALADFTWTGWDSIQALTVIATSGTREGQAVSNTALNFENGWRAGAGMEYQFRQEWLLRGGVAYDRSPVQDEFRTPRLPDENRTWLAAGVRFQPNATLSIDVGYAHLWVESGSSELASSGAVPGTLRGRYDSTSNILAAQASVRF